VPDTPVLDTCGAGDTFTAAISAFLMQDNLRINDNAIIRASEFAIDCCQEVIQKPFTSVVTTRNWITGETNVCDKSG
jgi:sugar/nucleoside kinase (ribokinase family)